MRDPNRIDIFCDTLKMIWHKVPDWRFGQLIFNIYSQLVGRDIFFVEDDESLQLLKDLFKEN